MPSMNDVEETIRALEGYIAAQIPIITGSLKRLTDDLSRYGPPELPEISTLPIFTTLTPPPPPPPAPVMRVADRSNKKLIVGLGVVIGVGLATGGWIAWSSRKVKIAKEKSKSKGRKDVVVLLGADTALGQLVISELRSNDYIVIASVATPEAITEVERHGKGYVKALVLDPTDPSSTPPFLRSLQSALSLKFPIAPGDPYAAVSLSDLPHLSSLISLLSLSPIVPSPNSNSILDLSISKDYLPHLISAHLTPLTIMQSILPLFKNKKRKDETSVIIALKGGSDSISNGTVAMSNAAMEKGCEMLRREISLSPDLKGTKLVIVDVGELGSGRRRSDPKRFSDAVIRVVGRQQSNTILSTMRDWWRGDRFSIGSGAMKYSLARVLPLWILDTLIIVPQRIAAYNVWIQHRTRNFKRDLARERRKRRREQQLSEEEHEDEVAKNSVVALREPKLKPSISSLASSSSVPSSPPSVDHVDTDSEAVPSAPQSEAGVGESWVMDVEDHAREKHEIDDVM